nr:serine hydrolase [Qingshengfaniella alkalisoli]
MVVDARTGEVLHSRNADTRLHPASLTKMMTLYVAFQAIEHGEISLDSIVTVSKNAAAEPPSKLYLKAGQKIALRYLIRASAVKSANDAATAIGEAISGSETAFAQRMTRTARSLGMTNTSFKNAHGLTAAGHLSTARDMTTLGRHIFYDYPQYYNLFSRRSADAGIRTVANTNRRLLDAYRGADGIKTGYTSAAGSNLVASAERGNVRIIATMFGGTSSAARNKRVAELLDMGFSRAPRRVAVNKPRKPAYFGNGQAAVVQIAAVKTSARPLPRPVQQSPAQVAALQAAVEETVRAAAVEGVTAAVVKDIAAAEVAVTAEQMTIPVPRPDEIEQAALQASTADVDAIPARAPVATSAVAATVSPQPLPRPTEIRFSSADVQTAEASPAPVTEVMVPRVSTSGGRHWGINVGTYNSQYEAERVLLKTALVEIETLDSALRKVVKGKTGYEANFVGLDEHTASLACQRLSAREQTCSAFGP